MYRIYFEKRFIAICDIDDPALNEPNILIEANLTQEELQKLPYEFEHSTLSRLFIPTEDKEKTLEAIAKGFTTIHAGGGVVTNPAGEFLMIYRNLIWDLPKGKLEDGEKIDECALREVKEETGIDNLTLVEPICITMHTYHLNNEAILKKTHWYKMLCNSDIEPTPQIEENITKVAWIQERELPQYLENTFPSIIEVFEQSDLI